MLLAEQKVTAFKQAHHLADVDVEERGAIEQFENADATVMALNQETASQQARVKALDASLQAANAAINSPGGVPDPSAVLLLQAKLNDLKTQRAILRTQITPDYPSTPGSPSLGSLDAEIRDFQGQLDRAKKATSNNAAPSIEARGAIAAADTDAHVQEALTQARLTAAIQSRQALQKKVQGLPGIRMQYAQLSQTAELASTLYTSLQAALNVTRLQKDQVSGNIQITQGAVLMGLPVKPNLKVNLLLALALGTLLSLCLVMLLEQMDQRVRTLDEIRALVAGPIIGMLPQTSRRRMNALTQGRMLPEFEEPFSLVRVNLSYVLRHAILREDLQHQIILVTSAVPGEGKSVTASQLAFSMAEAGKSVILVDANLRRPVQGFLFQTGETRGLANVLGGELALDEAIATSDVEGLSILHSGESRQNPTALLSSPRLGPLMEALRFKADVIIVDAPDCSSAADTLLLTAHADCLLQVVRAGYVEMDLLHNASLALHATGKKVTVLANGLTQPQQRIFKSRFAYAALTSSTEISVLPKTFEKTMIVNHSQDLSSPSRCTSLWKTPRKRPNNRTFPKMMKPLVIPSLLLAFTLAGTASAQAQIIPLTPSAPAVSSVPIALAPDYQIAPGDVLSVNVLNWPTDSAPQAMVAPDGTVSLNHINQVNVAGLTTPQATALLTKKWKKYFVNPVVTVALLQKHQQLVVFSGFLNHPGSLDYRPGLHLLDALAEAGGAMTTADSASAVVTHADGTKQTLDLTHPETKHGTPADLVLDPGDVVYLPEQLGKVSVVGQVKQPGSLPWNDHLTVLEAITDSGGIIDMYRADLKGAKLTHDGQDRPIDLDAMLNHGDLTGNVNLAPGDRLSIPEQLSRVSVVGQVKQPGSLPYNDHLTVLEAITDTGGIIDMERADLKGAKLMRNGQERSIDLDAMLNHGIMTDNVILAPGDRLTIPESNNRVYVFGDVQRPGYYYYKENDRVQDALSTALVAPDADTGKINVIHVNQTKTEARMVRVNLNEFQQQGRIEGNPLIQPGDSLYIPKQRTPFRLSDIFTPLNAIGSISYTTRLLENK